MEMENLTQSGGPSLLWSTCREREQAQSFHWVLGMEASLTVGVVVTVCLLAAFFGLRKPFRRRVPTKTTARRARWFGVVDRSLSFCSTSLRLSSPFSVGLGRSSQTRREALQAEPVTVALGDDSQEIKRRRAREKSAQGGVAPLASARTLGPRHVAVIMDGNRRFGRVKYRDPLKGHSDGGKRLGDFLEWCMEAGVAMATAFAFSTENWKRDAHEVQMLMDLVCSSCGELMEDAVKKNMRIRVLASDVTKLPERVLRAIRKAEDETRNCTGFLFNICLSYGARQEIANACRQIAGEVVSGSTSLDKVDECTVERHLLTSGLPDPDLLIRTSGEKRVSNFLLFQMAYTELFFVDKYWPDITRADVLDIFEEYKARERRFGC